MDNNLNYQTLFKIPYIFNLVNKILVSENLYKFSVIYEEKKFYIKEKNNDLIYINDVNLLHGYYKRFKQLLDTFIIFENLKNDPFNIYLNQLKYNNNNNNLDKDLLQSLQNQYILNKNYFIDFIDF